MLSLRIECGISSGFPLVSPAGRQVVYVLLDRSPLGIASPFDLHTLGTPLAFVLSQDQTLHEITSVEHHRSDAPRNGFLLVRRRLFPHATPLGMVAGKADQGCPRTVLTRLASAPRLSMLGRAARVAPYLVKFPTV